jgi:predicted anti-sigma-YlaC factor YlaD
MRCLDAQTALGTYVDGELDPEQAGHLEAHLAGCAECRVELAYLQVAEEAIETWPLITEPADFTAQVMAQVKPRLEKPRFRLRWSDVAISLAGAGMAAIALPLWQVLTSTDSWAQILLQTQDALRLHLLPLEMLQLDITLKLQPLIKSGALMWLPILAGLIFVLVVLPVVWFRGPRRPRSLA